MYSALAGACIQSIGEVEAIYKKRLLATSTTSTSYGLIRGWRWCGLIVETMKLGECTCKVDDSAYAEKSEEEIKRIVDNFSQFILECLQKKETA